MTLKELRELTTELPDETLVTVEYDSGQWVDSYEATVRINKVKKGKGLLGGYVIDQYGSNMALIFMIR